MSGSEKRTSILAICSIFVAGLSLTAAFYQNYIQTKYVEAIQRNVARAEYNRACRDLIEAYFQVKLKVRLVARNADRVPNPSTAESMLEIESANAVSRFAALGTYLANFQNEDKRFQYTQLSLTLEKVLAIAPNTPPADVAKLFEPADRLFAEMNDDCVRTAKSAPL